MKGKAGQVKGNILYKIYCGGRLAYLGRTKQDLQSRIRGHLVAKPMHRKINIDHVNLIEYAEFKTEADMFVYEIYLINLLKPPLNADDKARDNLTIDLPPVEWHKFETKLWGKWLENVSEQTKAEADRSAQRILQQEELKQLREKKRRGEITEDEYWKQRELLETMTSN